MDESIAIRAEMAEGETLMDVTSTGGFARALI
jgi:hypothetical protein